MSKRVLVSGIDAGSTSNLGTDISQLLSYFIGGDTNSGSGVLDKSGGHLLVSESGTPAMTVDVASGVAFIRDNNSTEFLKKLRVAEIDADVTDTLTVSSNSTGADRIDACVAYVDLAGSSAVRGLDHITLDVIDGTNGASAMSDSQLQTAVDSLVSGYTDVPFIRLADITVADGASSIVDANISDTRIQVRHKPNISQYRDSDIYITSDDDGHLDLHADTSIDINGDFVFLGSNGAYPGGITQNHVSNNAAVEYQATDSSGTDLATRIILRGNGSDDIEFYQGDRDSEYLVWEFRLGNLRPSGHKERDIGVSSGAVDDIYADDFQNVADFPFLDERTENGKRIKVDDLEIINNIKPHPEKVVDKRTGFTLIDDWSLPKWLFTKDKKTGKIATDIDGKPYLALKTTIGLLLGAVRQLSDRLDQLQKA